MTFETIIYETNGPVAHIGMNRPKQYNALDWTMRSDLLRAIKKADGDPEIRVVVLFGAGRGFSSGNDLAAGSYGPTSEFIDREYGGILQTIRASDKIFIAQVHGNAAGVSASLAMTCDLVAMAQDASIYMAFAAISLVPDGGNCFHLLNAMGYHHAMELILEGGRLSADDAKSYGICNRVYDPTELSDKVTAWANDLAAGAPLAMGAVKRLLRDGHLQSFDETVTAEGLEQNSLTQSNDFRRGVEAFFQKTKPAFEGN